MPLALIFLPALQPQAGTMEDHRPSHGCHTLHRRGLCHHGLFCRRRQTRSDLHNPGPATERGGDPHREPDPERSTAGDQGSKGGHQRRGWQHRNIELPRRSNCVHHMEIEHSRHLCSGCNRHRQRTRRHPRRADRFPRHRSANGSQQGTDYLQSHCRDRRCPACFDIDLLWCCSRGEKIDPS